MSKIKIFSLGGQNENGKNLYIVEVDQDLFVFDAGLKHADDQMLGVDYIIPNYDYLKKNEKRIKGIFITHCHDEHMGALPDILTDLKTVKVYATAFTKKLIDEELKMEGLSTTQVVEITPHKQIKFGDNSVFPVSLTHSVPEAVGFALNTKNGTIFYTGNYVFDPTMIGSYKTDIGKLAYIGKQGVLALLSETLYADKQGFTSPKHRISPIIKETLSKATNRIIFNIFQAELRRIQELFTEIMLTNRKVVVLGRNLEKLIRESIKEKYLEFDESRIISIDHINDSDVVVLVTDEKEKPYSNILRIVNGYDKFVKLKETDTVVFAAPIYDGLERQATKIFDIVSKIGSNLVIVTNKNVLEHHASSEDIMMMIDLLNPKYFIPVIGEYKHFVHAKELAKQVGVKEENILLKLNGQITELNNGKLVESKEKVKIDDILIDGKTVGDIGETVLRDREHLSESGLVILNYLFDKKTKKQIEEVSITMKGFIMKEDNEKLKIKVKEISDTIINEHTKRNYIDYREVKNDLRDKVSKFLYRQTESKPMVIIITQEV